jgi:hypothetical protein
MDGETWREIDRRTGIHSARSPYLATFAVSESAECRFIRVTQTGNNMYGNDRLAFHAFEVFGTLVESQ